MSYAEFLAKKTQEPTGDGFSPLFVPSAMFDFQVALHDWAQRRGRAALFAECGMGKTLMQLAWAENVVRFTNRPVLILAPLSVASQTVREGASFGIEVVKCSDGKTSGPRIYVTNYEKLHLFDESEFSGVVCDESSILKSFDGATRNAIIQFTKKLRFRLLASATPAPNDTTELGNSSEALGHIGHQDMLSRFFTNSAQSLSPISLASKWRLKPHAKEAFWRWVCSWARAIRKPSDIGFDDGPMVLPPIDYRITEIKASSPRPGCLFVEPARDLREQRQDRRNTIKARCEKVAELSADADSFVAWCHLNDEGDMLERIIPGAVQVSGKDSDDEKEEKYEAFRTGQARVLVSKSIVSGMGMNWQHCHRMSFFTSHSYEQFYQSVRRCWRYGQKSPVVVDIVTTDGEPNVLENLRSKAEAADAMFSLMVSEMNNEVTMARTTYKPLVEFRLPSFLKESA